MVDGSGATIGAVVAATNYTVTVRTPLGYLATINWNGTFPRTNNLEFSGAGCTGTPYIYTQQQGASISARSIAYSKTFNNGSLLVPEASAAQLAAGFVSPVAYNYASYEDSNGTCQPDGPSDTGFQLKVVTANDVGLPALANGAVKTPITFKQ